MKEKKMFKLRKILNHPAKNSLVRKIYNYLEIQLVQNKTEKLCSKYETTNVKDMIVICDLTLAVPKQPQSTRHRVEPDLINILITTQ